MVDVLITDSGIGMDESFLPHAFKLFKQESAMIARTHEDDGLGLPIAQALAK